MSLLNDLLQALLIPLVTWDLHLFGRELAFDVTPLLVILILVAMDQGLRYVLRRSRRLRRSDWTDAQVSTVVAES